MGQHFIEGQRRRFYREMLRIRVFEDRVFELFEAGRVPGTVHQYQGQEAVAVGVCAVLRADDVITSTHRSHGHAIARGLPLREVAAELYGKAAGCCRGKGGSMHLGDLRRGMLPAIAIVAGSIPIAAGLALSQKMLGSDRVTVCFFGDGAVGEGAFHEGVNLAAVWRLPVVFVCENNQYAASTPYSLTAPVPHVALRAAAYGIPALTVDGMDAEAVASAVGEAVDRARGGEGPTLVECETFRFCGHSRSDRNKYRSEEEERYWRARDPIVLQQRRLREAGLLTEEDDAEIRAQIRAEVEEALSFAEAADYPPPEALWSDVFVPGPRGAPDFWPGEAVGEVQP
jgi:TPP-dependent pyruvate/acetoin dehydrogenase alpha subunit